MEEKTTSYYTRYMQTLFHNYWKKGKKLQVVYQNLIGKTPAGTDPFAQVGVIHTSANRCALTGVSHGRFRHRGILNIKIFIPTNTGLDDGYKYVDDVLAIYRNPPSDCEINFSGFSFVEQDMRYKDFFCMNITIDFDYDTFL